MIREEVLFQSPLIRIALYDHPPGTRHRDPKAEVANAFAVSLVQQGAFELGLYRGGRGALAMRPGALMVTHPGFAYRCHHAESEPTDRCMEVRPVPALVESLASEGVGRLERIGPTPQPDNRIGYRFARLRSRLARSAGACEVHHPDPADVESIALDLLATVAAGAPPRGRSFRHAQVAWYQERIDTVREMLQDSFGRPHTLSSMASEAGMSPFHFARVFGELTGLPPHRYLREVRLRAARRMLREGAPVTQTALACGFPSLSHFTRTFRARFGASPSGTRNAQEKASGLQARTATLLLNPGAAVARRDSAFP